MKGNSFWEWYKFLAFKEKAGYFWSIDYAWFNSKNKFKIESYPWT